MSSKAATPNSSLSLSFAKGPCMGFGYTMAALSAPHMGKHGRLLCTLAGLAGVAFYWDAEDSTSVVCAGFAGGGLDRPQGSARAVLVKGAKLGVFIGVAAVCVDWIADRWDGK